MKRLANATVYTPATELSGGQIVMVNTLLGPALCHITHFQDLDAIAESDNNVYLLSRASTEDFWECLSGMSKTAMKMMEKKTEEKP